MYHDVLEHHYENDRVVRWCISDVVLGSNYCGSSIHNGFVIRHGSATIVILGLKYVGVIL